MGDWIFFEESTYAQLCDLNVGDDEKWLETNFLVPEEHDNLDKNPRLRVVVELVINALQFCVTNGLSYPSAAILIESIRNELTNLSSCEFLDEQACKSRYLETMGKYNGENSLPVEELKNITKFYSQQFVRHLQSYQYVLMEPWLEGCESRVLEVQTPLVPPVLSSAIVE